MPTETFYVCSHPVNTRISKDLWKWQKSGAKTLRGAKIAASRGAVHPVPAVAYRRDIPVPRKYGMPDKTISHYLLLAERPYAEWIDYHSFNEEI